MSTFDFLGLKKGLAPEPEGPAAPAAKGRSLSPKAWVALAAADLLLAVVCGAVLFLRVTAGPDIPAPPPSKGAAAKPTPKKVEKAPEPAKPPEPAPKAEPARAEPAKPEPQKAEPAKAAAQTAKVPLGSPSVHATPPPQHRGAPKAATDAKPAPAAAAAKKAQTRPVPFSHTDSDAKEVSLMGAFLVRSGGRKMMFKDSKGVWTTTVYLVVGQTYKYRFEVSGPKGKKLTPYQKVEVLDGE